MMPIWFRHIRILLVEEIRDILARPRAILAVVLYLVSISLVMYGMIEFDTAFGQLLKEQGSTGKILRQILERLKLEKYSVLLDRIEDWPILFPVFQFYLIFWLPTFVALVSCDMMTTDRARGTLRFLFLKTTRWRYFLSKFLAHFFLYLVLQAFSLLLLASGVLYVSGSNSLESLQGPFLYCFLMFIPYCMFVLAATQLTSVLAGGTLSALLLVHLFWFVMMCVMIFWHSAPLKFSDFTGIVFPFEGFAQQSLLVLAGWSAAFLALGYLLFRKSEI